MINTKRFDEMLSGKMLTILQLVADELTDRGYTVEYTVKEKDGYIGVVRTKNGLLQAVALLCRQL